MDSGDRSSRILEFMKSEEYVPMKAKELATIFRVPKKEYSKFLEILGELELNLKIEKNRKGVESRGRNLTHPETKHHRNGRRLHRKRS